MTDRELLELAAKAAGIEKPSGQGGFVDSKGAYIFYLDCEGKTWRTWNPLESDGDALRLAVKLCMSIDFREDCTVNAEVYQQDRMSALAYEPLGDDPAAATRRAIVRAAAAIGAQ